MSDIELPGAWAWEQTEQTIAVVAQIGVVPVTTTALAHDVFGSPLTVKGLSEREKDRRFKRVQAVRGVLRRLSDAHCKPEFCKGWLTHTIDGYALTESGMVAATEICQQWMDASGGNLPELPVS